MAGYRGCRASPARSAQWQSHGPIQWVAILRRGTPQAGAWVAESGIQGFAAGEARLDRVPVRDRRLVEQPAQVDLAAVEHRREVDEAAVEVADDDVEPLERLEPERHVD